MEIKSIINGKEQSFNIDIPEHVQIHKKEKAQVFVVEVLTLSESDTFKNQLQITLKEAIPVFKDIDGTRKITTSDRISVEIGAFLDGLRKANRQFRRLLAGIDTISARMGDATSRQISGLLTCCSITIARIPYSAGSPRWVNESETIDQEGFHTEILAVDIIDQEGFEEEKQSFKRLQNENIKAAREDALTLKLAALNAKAAILANGPATISVKG